MTVIAERTRADLGVSVAGFPVNLSKIPIFTIPEICSSICRADLLTVLIGKCRIPRQSADIKKLSCLLHQCRFAVLPYHEKQCCQEYRVNDVHIQNDAGIIRGGVPVDQQLVYMQIGRAHV